MKLAEYLQSVDCKTRLYIGSKSSFFFIGNKKEASDLLPKIEKQYLKSFNKKLNELLNQKSSTEDKIYQLKIKKPTKSKLEMIDIYSTDLLMINQNIAYQKKIIETFKPFGERDVLDIFEKSNAFNDGGFAIKIEGYEAGNYWTLMEWLEDKH